VADREPTRIEFKSPSIREIGVVLYALFMALVHSHYITAQFYPQSDYFFGVWYGVSDAQLLVGESLGILANIGLLLSPFLHAPGRALRFLMIGSLCFGAVVSTIQLVHLFSIHALHPFWPARPVDHIYIKMFFGSLLLYAVDLIAICFYLSRIRRLHISAHRVT
jgi:hypothetical protein